MSTPFFSKIPENDAEYITLQRAHLLSELRMYVRPEYIQIIKCCNDVTIPMLEKALKKAKEINNEVNDAVERQLATRSRK